jgi:hypothetical protein
LHPPAKGEWKAERPNDELTLVFDTETTADAHQEVRFGIAQVYVHGRLSRTLVFTGLVRDTESRTIQRWAARHHAGVLTVEDFVIKEFLPLALRMRAVVVGFNLPFDLSRGAVEWEPKRKVRSTPAWTLWLVPRTDPAAAFTPRIRVQSIDSTKAFISFTGAKGRAQRYPGAFVDLRTFVFALTGERHSLKSAGEAFGCKRKKSEADYYGPVTDSYLDYCLNDVALAAELYVRCQDRYRAFCLQDHPSRIYSPASLAKAMWKKRGVAPPKLPPAITGRLMAAFYAGKVECRVRGREVQDVALLDFTSQYPSLFCLLGAEDYLTAGNLVPKDSTSEVRSLVENLTFEDLFRPETWRDPRMWSLCEVEPDGAILPIRSTYGGPAGGAPTIGWNHVTTEEGVTLPYLVPDLVAARFLGGRVPRIVQATTFEPKGCQDVRPLSILGVEVGRSDNLVQTLVETRILEKRTRKRGWRSRSDGLKMLANAGSYGIFVEVNRRSRSGKVQVHGLGDEPFEVDETEVEEPGVDFCPLVGTMLTSAAHLLLAMIDLEVERRAGRVVYCDTDSAFVTPSKVAQKVCGTFARLNPYSVGVPFLKDETNDKAPRSGHPRGSVDRRPRFFGLSAKRYCLLVRDRQGYPHVFGKAASDHGLGSFEVSEDRGRFVSKLWEAIISRGEAAAEDYAGLPATSPFSLSTPNLLPRVRNLGPIRPFTFLTASLLEPSPDPDEDRSELVAYVPASDSAARAKLMDLPRQRSWGSVVEAFVRHQDRKCAYDLEGRMIRRHVFVRRSNLVGLGKEANRVEEARVVGPSAVSGRARRYIDWKRRVLELSPSWAKAHGIPERSLRYLKGNLRVGRTPHGHGSRTFERVVALL